MISEQQEIVRQVGGLFALADQVAQRLEQARKQVNKLMPSLLARAFAGQLVPKNPADPVASPAWTVPRAAARISFKSRQRIKNFPCEMKE